jgi:hypothetical protein
MGVMLRPSTAFAPTRRPPPAGPARAGWTPAAVPWWRLLAGVAPPLCAASFAGASAWIDGELLRLAAVRGLLALLAALAALGAAVAWRTARQRRPGVPTTVARAAALARGSGGAELVTLRGRIHALPDAPPLVSPGGELCLWFGRARTGGDSVRPFLLVDASGRCVVLPAGAEVADGPAPRLRARGGERLLHDGDRVQVSGRLVCDPAAVQALQAHAAVLVARSGLAASALVSSNRPAARRRTRADAARGLPFADTAPHAGVAGLAAVAAPAGAAGLPVVAAPAGSQPLAITLLADEPAGDVFGALALVDGLVLLVAAALAAWPGFAAA